MSSHLEQHLGRCMSAREVAEFLCCDISAVYRNYVKLGGIKVGIRYKFFEKTLINALLEQNKKEVDRAGGVQRKKVSGPARQQRSGSTVGTEEKNAAGGGKRKNAADRHGLFD